MTHDGIETTSYRNMGIEHVTTQSGQRLEVNAKDAEFSKQYYLKNLTLIGLVRNNTQAPIKQF
jgi:hypothetical protein